MISLDEARDLLARSAAPLEGVELPLEEALGCRIVGSPRADVDMPPGDVSAMDGYATRCADLEPGAPLPVAFEIQAGQVSEPLPVGHAARIFTGAVLPAGADTVVPQEQAVAQDDGAVLLERHACGSHVRPGGDVLTRGAAIAEPGDLVTPQRVALLAAAGAHRVAVVPRPRIAVVITGAEIVPACEVPGPGQIRNSNGPMLDALVRSAGLAAPTQRHAVDTTADLRQTLQAAFEEADLVVTSGGVSVGDYDLVPEVARSLGGEVLFHRVAVKPGKPVLAVTAGDRWLIGLPGNPVSVLAGWRMFARPLAGVLGGDIAAFDEPPVSAVLAEPVSVEGGRTELRPAVLTSGDDGPTVRVLPWRGSHDLVAAAAANALARVEARSSHRAGDVIPCYPLDA